MPDRPAAQEGWPAPLLALAALGLAARLAFLLTQTWLEGDFAVMGLMAKHLLERREFPVYVWLNQYGGCLSTYLMALWFKLLGLSATTYWITGFLSSCASAGLLFLLAERLFGRPGSYFALALALLPSYHALYITFWYQYGDTLTIGTGLLLLLARYMSSPDKRPRLAAALGLISGVGLWTSPMFLPFMLTQAWVFLKRPQASWRQEFPLWAGGFLLGYAPAICYNVKHPGDQLHRLAGRVFSVGRAEWEGSPSHGRLLVELLARKLLRVPAVALRVPAQFAELTNWLDAAALAAALTRPRRGLAAVFLCCFLLVHVLIVGDPSQRQMFPLHLPFVILVGGALGDLWGRRRAAAALALAALLAPHAYSLGAGLARPDKMSVREVNALLRARGVAGAYSDYWAAYSLMFDSREEIPVSPTLFHPTFDDRYPPYTESVRKAGKAALVVSRDLNPCAPAAIERALEAQGVRYGKTEVNEFVVYDGFSRRVFPEELDLGPYQKCR